MFLDFDVNLDTAISELNTLLEKSKKEIDDLLLIEEKTYANFVKPFEMIDERLEWFFTPVSHLNSVSNSEKTQEVYADALPILTEYGTEVSQNEDIYKAFKQIKEDEERLSKSKKRMEDLTEENLKSWFNTQDVCRDTKNSAKYYEAAKKQLNL